MTQNEGILIYFEYDGPTTKPPLWSVEAYDLDGWVADWDSANRSYFLGKRTCNEPFHPKSLEDELFTIVLGLDSYDCKITIEIVNCDIGFQNYLVEKELEFKGVIYRGESEVVNVVEWEHYTLSFQPSLPEHLKCDPTLEVFSNEKKIENDPFSPPDAPSIELDFKVTFNDVSVLKPEMRTLTVFRKQTHPENLFVSFMRDIPSSNYDCSFLIIENESECDLKKECEIDSDNDEATIKVITTKQCILNEFQTVLSSEYTDTTKHPVVICPEIPSFSLDFDEETKQLFFNFEGTSDFFSTIKSHERCIYMYELTLNGNSKTSELRELQSQFLCHLSPGSYEVKLLIFLPDSDIPNQEETSSFVIPESNDSSSSITLLLICILVPVLVMIVSIAILLIVHRKRSCCSTVYKLDDVLSTTNMTMDDSSVFQTEMM